MASLDLHICLWVLLCACAGGGAASAQTSSAPAPLATIYPGEILLDSMLGDVSPTEFLGGDIVRVKGDAVGRVARRTLFAGRPIPRNAIEDPHAIINGGLVQLIYEQPGISITANGQALQAARVGDAIRVRNVESGIVVSGIVSASGIVRVNR